jgi:hypothetical protein
MKHLLQLKENANGPDRLPMAMSSDGVPETLNNLVPTKKFYQTFGKDSSNLRKRVFQSLCSDRPALTARHSSAVFRLCVAGMGMGMGHAHGMVSVTSLAEA